MKKTLWVTRDETGYNIWTEEPYYSDSDEMFICDIGPYALYDDDCDITWTKFKRKLHGCEVKLAMNECKRIELTINAEVREV